MWNKFKNKSLSLILLIAFSSAVLFSSESANAQSFFKINEAGPGGTTSTSSSSEGNKTSTIIYVAMGAAVVGVLLYKFVFQKNKDVDSTSTEKTSSLLLPGNSNITDRIVNNNLPAEQPPVNLFFGIRRDNIATEEKTYVLGVSVKF